MTSHQKDSDCTLNPATDIPACPRCGAAVTHGCNTALCSEECASEAAFEHERAHAGISEVDDCDMDECPLSVWRDAWACYRR